MLCIHKQRIYYLVKKSQGLLLSNKLTHNWSYAYCSGPAGEASGYDLIFTCFNELWANRRNMWNKLSVNSNLQWGPHIDGLASRVSSTAFAVKKFKSIVDIETAPIIYFGYFHSIMSYSILVWRL